MARFLPDDDELLIEEVQKYQSIYNYEHENYKNNLVKENGWKEIAAVVKKSEEDCKKRWRSIKDTYFRNRKKLGTGSSSSEKPIKWNLYKRLSFLNNVKHERTSKNTLEIEEKNYLEENCSDTFPESVENSSDFQSKNSNPVTPESQKNKEMTDTQQESLTSESRSSTPSLKNKKRKSQAAMQEFEQRAQKRMQLLEEIHKKQQRAEADDDVDLFMKSICLTVKKLPSFLRSQAKIDILNVVTKLERAVDTCTPESVFVESYNSDLDAMSPEQSTPQNTYIVSYEPSEQQTEENVNYPDIN